MTNQLEIFITELSAQIHSANRNMFLIFSIYFIKNDLGYLEWYDFNIFLTIEKLRDKKIEEIL